MSGKP